MPSNSVLKEENMILKKENMVLKEAIRVLKDKTKAMMDRSDARMDKCNARMNKSNAMEEELKVLKEEVKVLKEKFELLKENQEITGEETRKAVLSIEIEMHKKYLTGLFDGPNGEEISRMHFQAEAKKAVESTLLKIHKASRPEVTDDLMMILTSGLNHWNNPKTSCLLSGLWMK